ASSTIGGEFGSTVSRYLTSERSSMRPPLSEIEPERLGVSMRTRGAAASAASRLMVCGATVPPWAGACRAVPRAGGVCGSRPGLWRRGGGRPLAPPWRLLRVPLLLLPKLRPAKIPLPHDQHERGQHDGEDGVLLVAHLGTRSRRSARLKSSVICANGSDKAARRPIST